MADLGNAVIGAQCPRCGATIPVSGAGRPRRWCSDRCRRLAYDERRAARNGAVGIEFREPAQPPEVVEIVHERVVTREVFRSPTPQEALQIVAASPRACRDILLALATKAAVGELAENRHAATVDAAVKLIQTLERQRLIRRR